MQPLASGGAPQAFIRAGVRPGYDACSHIQYINCHSIIHMQSNRFSGTILILHRKQGAAGRA